LLGAASYAVLIHRPAASFPASFTPSSRIDALRFPSVVVTRSRKDFHLQVSAHAGHTTKKENARPSVPGVFRKRSTAFSGANRYS
jgi:hypothetical protein